MTDAAKIARGLKGRLDYLRWMVCAFIMPRWMLQKIERSLIISIPIVRAELERIADE